MNLPWRKHAVLRQTGALLWRSSMTWFAHPNHQMWISEHVSGSSCQVAECGPSISPRYWVTTGWSHQPISQLSNLATSFRMHNWVLLRSIWRADRWQFETRPWHFHFSTKPKALKWPFSSLQLERALDQVQRVQTDHFRLNVRVDLIVIPRLGGVLLTAEC